ncbi:guanylate kinase [Candidatus Pseudothioglobus singularis]|nr:guanylate kinase [Candidatus Pseudothioglobus singularis]
MSNLFIIAAPSGCGKTTLVDALLNNSEHLYLSVTHTTRKPRVGEVDGVNYHFISKTDFKKMILNTEFVEHAEVFGNLYGSSREKIQENLNKNIDVILEIDWQGARQVKANMPNAISIFILPPSKKSLLERLKGRGQDDDETIKNRMSDAENQMKHYDEFDYLVINDIFEDALSNLKTIIHNNENFNKSEFKLEKQVLRHKYLLKELI